MGFPRKTAIVASAITLLLILAISLAASLQVRAPSRKLIQITIAQAAKLNQSDYDSSKQKGKINDTHFDRADILSGSSTIAVSPTEFYLPTTYLSLGGGAIPTTSVADEGMIGLTPTSQPTSTTLTTSIIPSQPTAPKSPPTPQSPILALSYTGSGGPKHCRGTLVQRLNIPHPAASWKNGTCIDLPAMARCGVFFAGKDDHCEAQLFNEPKCFNNSMTFVNTVVFMPEERPVGAWWRSMWVRCGVEVPEAKVLDPGLFGGIVKPGKKGGG
jgi:hypothetical protein